MNAAASSSDFRIFHFQLLNTLIHELAHVLINWIGTAALTHLLRPTIPFMCTKRTWRALEKLDDILRQSYSEALWSITGFLVRETDRCEDSIKLGL